MGRRFFFWGGGGGPRFRGQDDKGIIFTVFQVASFLETTE